MDGEAGDGKGKGKGAGKGKGGKKRGRKGAAAEDDDGGRSSLAPECQTLCASIELVCSCLVRGGPVAERRGGGGGGGRGRGEEEEGEGVVKTLFALLKSQGQPDGEGEMGLEEQAELRLAGSTCLARLCMFSARVRVSGLRDSKRDVLGCGRGRNVVL